ncbi:MAG: universal stress protein [Nitrospiraceae bacterium]|nr:universal stress protein [Nitrospiraceae bacterium]
MEDIKRIMVVSRMSEDSHRAIHYGVGLAGKVGAELAVIHIIHNPFNVEGWNLPIPSLADEYEKILKKTKDELDAIIRVETKKGMQVKELIRKGDPTKEVLKAIKEEQIDLLVMSAHEEGHLEHFLFGRSNEEIARKMPCSIMLVRLQPGTTH